MIYREGDFSFIPCPMNRMVLEHDYRVVSRHRLWDYLKKKSFDDPEFIGHMRQYGWWHTHTGQTLAITIKRLEYIAKYGWDAFVFIME